MNYWAGKRAVVTGGSSGLGRVLAGLLVERRARVLLVARGQDALNETAAALGEGGGTVHTVAADLTQLADAERVAQRARAELGGVDVVCHCAGRSMRGEILAMSAQQLRELWEINFLASAQLTQLLAGDLVASRGHVVLVGSLASKVAPRYLGAYPTSKFPLSAYAQQLRLQWGNDGPHVLLVCPGPIAREDANRRYDDQSADIPEAARRAGGGAKVRAIDPRALAERMLRACERRQAELIVPAKARLLFALTQLSPRWGDWLLKRTTGE